MGWASLRRDAIAYMRADTYGNAESVSNGNKMLDGWAGFFVFPASGWWLQARKNPPGEGWVGWGGNQLALMRSHTA